MNNDYFSPDNKRTDFAEDKSEFNFDSYQTPVSDYPSVNAPLPANRQRYEEYNRNQIFSDDEKHLNQLAKGFKIYAIINFVFSCIPFIHLFLGILMFTGRLDDGRNAPPPLFGLMFIIMAVIFITLGWTVSALNFYAGRSLKEKRNYTFCFVMSCINCTFMPLGTVLGVFGIIILLRDSVKNLFQDKNPDYQ